MAGPARHACRQAARAGLLTALAAACANVQQPPGGPPDFSPPVLLTVRPESGSVAPAFRERVRFEFDEVVSELQGRLDDFVLISPRPEAIDVNWKRTAIEVQPDGGWRRNTVYHVTLLSGIQDLRNNRRDSTTRLVFTTGGPIPQTELSGLVLDWENGQPGRGALIEALLLPDSLVYLGQADSTGAFRLAALPTGRYTVTATIDGNTNRRRDRREPWDSVMLTLDSTGTGEFWAFVHDTTGPRLREARRLDSLAVSVHFDQKLAPGDPTDDAVEVFLLPDTVGVPVTRVLRQTVHDSLRALERAAADSAAAAADTAATDTTAADTTAAAEPRPMPAEAAPDTTVADSTAAQRLLATRRPLIDTWVVRVGHPLTPGTRYLLAARARNLNGAVAESRTLLILPTAPDTTAADTTGAGGGR